MNELSIKRKEYIIEIALYYINNKSTIRKTAKHFHKSKSSIHIVLQKQLKLVDRDLYRKYLEVAKFNISQRYIRSGLATQRKYANKKEVSNK